MPPPGDGFAWQARRLAVRPCVGKNNRLQRPNNSLKPSPLRGLDAVWQACTPRRGRSAARLSSGVRRRQTKIFSTWGSPTERHCNLHSLSATYSVQLESSCTPSVDELSREKLAGAQNPCCAAGPGWAACPEILDSLSKSSLVSRLTIRSSRVRFAASSAARYH